MYSSDRKTQLYVTVICILLSLICLLASCGEANGQGSVTDSATATVSPESEADNSDTVSEPEITRTVSVISYNIAYYNSTSDSFSTSYANQTADDYTYEKRAARLKSLIEYYKPDVFCLQEVNASWWRLIVSDGKFIAGDYTLADNRGCYGGADGQPSNSELYNLLFYRTDRFEKEDGGIFWLSSTPEAYGPGTNADAERACTWAKLTDRITGKTAVYATTHFSTVSTSGGGDRNISQARVLTSQLTQLSGKLPVIVCGDYNMHETSTYGANSYKYITERQGFSDAQCNAVSKNTMGTVRNWGKTKGWQTANAIDHAFYKGVFAESYKVLYDTFTADNVISRKLSDVGINYDLSDHLGIHTVFNLEK